MVRNVLFDQRFCLLKPVSDFPRPYQRESKAPSGLTVERTVPKATPKLISGSKKIDCLLRMPKVQCQVSHAHNLAQRAFLQRRGWMVRPTRSRRGVACYLQALFETR